MSRNQGTNTSTSNSSVEERQLGSNSNQQLIPGNGSEVMNQTTEDGKRKNFISATFSLLSVVLLFGGIAIPKWSLLISSNGHQLGEYGLFMVKILQTDGVNTTLTVYQNLFEFYNPGEISLIVCIAIVLLFNLGLTVSGVIVSLGFCPVYLNFLAAFSVFNVFAIFNYLAVMGLWLWVTDRIPHHSINSPIREIYPDVHTQFDYGYYIIIICTGLLTMAAVCNFLDLSLLKNGCFKRKARTSPTVVVNPRYMRASLSHVIIQLPLQPPEYREELSPLTSPIVIPTFSHYLRSANTSFVV